jgi:hypothetical protein
VAGPYTALSCKLTLVESALRVKDARAADLRQDEALQRSAGPAEAIFTSSANGDSGMWEANLHDERYLPFEGAGAVNSVWRVELPALVRQFNYATISDVVLEIRYSAEASSDAAAAEKNLAKILAKQEQSPLWAYTSLRSDLPDDFNALRKGGRSEALRLHLPSGLGKWMGLPLKADGSMIVVLVGTPSAAGGKIAVEAASKPAAATFDAGPYLSASFDGLASNALFGDKGFSLDVSGMEALDDVLIFVKGTTTAPAP